MLVVDMLDLPKAGWYTVERYAGAGYKALAEPASESDLTRLCVLAFLSLRASSSALKATPATVNLRRDRRNQTLVQQSQKGTARDSSAVSTV